MKTQKNDPFELLKKDHRVVEELFAALLDTTERAEVSREDLFAKLQTALTNHAELEESTLYPVLEEKDPTHELTLEAEEEHAVVKTLLAELGSEQKTTEQWTAKLKVLEENVSHHVKEEEDELFPKAQHALSETEAAELEGAIEAGHIEE